MADTSEMIIASLSKIWHLIPIVIAIVLFKKFINKKDKNRRIDKNEEHEKNGLTLELRAGKKYEDLDYKVTYLNEDDKKESGIDLVCIKGNKTLLIFCKNYSKAKSITSEDIKTFHSSAVQYVKTNDIEEKDVEFRYVVPYSDVLDRSAIKILMNNAYNCKYVVL
jgi:hypothetical protein